MVSVYLTGRRLDRLPAEAGQFFTWRFLGRPGWTRANPYSLSAAPDGRGLRITVQARRRRQCRGCTLRPGTRVLVEGPYGRLSARARTRRKVAFIGAGVGITPLRALAEGLPYAPGRRGPTRTATREAPLFAGEFERLGARPRPAASLRLPGRRRGADSWLGAGHRPRRRPRPRCAHWIPDIAERDVYVCGPAPWTDLVRARPRPPGLPPEHLHLETFRW